MWSSAQPEHADSLCHIRGLLDKPTLVDMGHVPCAATGPVPFPGALLPSAPQLLPRQTTSVPYRETSEPVEWVSAQSV